jgi:hypothetical protein
VTQPPPAPTVEPVASKPPDPAAAEPAPAPTAPASATPAPAAAPEHDTLREAWRRFGSYDAAADERQRWFVRLRSAILIVGIVVTAAGLTTTAAATGPAAEPGAIAPVLRWVTFVASLALTGLFLVAWRFDLGSAWVLSRRSAELLLREIFLYRTGCGPYRVAGRVAAKARPILAARIFGLNREAPSEFGPARPGNFEPRIVLADNRQPIALAGGAVDDGLCALTADDYLRMRLTAQQTWYRDRAVRLRSSLRNYYLAGIVAGLAGAALTFAEGAWIAWVAVTTAIAAAVTSWLELRRLEPTAIAYERAASELGDLALWWHALTEDDRRCEDNIERLVTECEAVLESENASWTQDMRKRVCELREEAQRRAASGKPT